LQLKANHARSNRRLAHSLGLRAAEKILKKDKQDDNTAGHARSNARLRLSEGELTAAKRLAEKVIKLYGPRFVDVFTTDALYINYPFVSLIKKELQKDIIAYRPV